MNMSKIDKMKDKIISSIDVESEASDDEIKEIIDEIILKDSEIKKLSIAEKLRLKKEIFHSIRGMDVLQELLENEEITEIMVNGVDSVFYEMNGEIFKSKLSFKSEEKLQDIIQQIVSRVNRRVNEATPIVDIRLKDGSRVNVVLNPIAINGPIITIRKFPKERLSMDKLIEIGAITIEAAKALEIFVKAGYNIFISGGTGSGKTTFLNALSDYIPKNERIITIEDSAELQITGIENLVRLEMRQANSQGENEITIRDLIRASLRMRPDRIIVGEVRGAETLDMLQAMNTGHDGSLSTGHANSPKDMLSRLETMVLMGIDMPLAAIKGQIAAGVDIIVHLGRLRNRARKVLEITEVVDYSDGDIKLNPLYKFDFDEMVLMKTDNELVNSNKMMFYKMNGD
ncbi:MAG: CpaF family protein [Lachnospiraceae bacterium]|nr:CpaF family protein [Lachnospiraceae bacterium]